MASPTKLFDLIKSLSKSEKRYFRMRSTVQMKGEINQYMRLFERIDRQREYNEDELMEVFRGEFIGDNFAEAKYYLYQAILKSLHAFHAAESPAMKIRTLIHQAHILFTKGLYDQCPALLARARRLAVKHEEWAQLQGVFRMEYELLMLEANAPDTHANMRMLFDEIERCARLEANRVEYWRRHALLFTRYRGLGLPRSPEELAEMRALAEPDASDANQLPLTMSAWVYHHQSIALISDMSRDFERTLESHLAVLELTSAFEPRRTDDRRVVPTLYNICVGSIAAGRYDQFFTYYPDLLRLSAPQPGELPSRRHINALVLRPHVLELAGYFDRAVEAIADIEACAATLDDSARPYVRDHIATVGFIGYFGSGDYEKVLDYINELTTIRNRRENLSLIVRTIALIVHFELQQFDLLEYLLKSTYKYLRSKEKLFGFERAVLDFIRRAMSVRSESELDLVFSMMSERLDVLKNDPFEHYPAMIIDLQSWIESKITKHNFATVVRDKFTARHGDIFELAEKQGVASVLNI